MLGHPTAILAVSEEVGSEITAIRSRRAMLISRHYPELICFARVSFVKEVQNVWNEKQAACSN